MEYGAAIIIDELPSLELKQPSPAAAAVYDQPISLRLLYEDSDRGEEHYVVRYPAGLKGRPHLHTAAHTIIVLEGQFDANGHVIGPGSYAHFPAGQVMRHQSARNAPCLFVLLFHGPFDVRLADEKTTPTSRHSELDALRRRDADEGCVHSGATGPPSPRRSAPVRPSRWRTTRWSRRTG